MSLTIGAEYNSNLTVEELDLNATIGGSLVNIDLITDYRFQLTEESSLQIAYDFSQSLHRDYSEYNYQSHGFSTSFETKLGDTTASLDYSYYDSSLDDTGLITFAMLTPAIYFMINDEFLISGEYSQFEKDFDDLKERDAIAKTGSVSAFYFFNDAKSYMRIAIRNTNEDADSNQLDYEDFTTSLSIKTPATWIKSGAFFKASYSFSDRDYEHITHSIGEIRTEQKNYFVSTFSIPVNETTDIIAALEMTNRSSNFPVANYDENRLMLSVQFSL
ncbi:MAG: hypothetical protein GY829_12110 [Gammaproteobacteria bacterium]|nr:hypothetical protein [Gammaproteobacteria bacterium]